jgi:serine/threonine protein kinase, bacterial
MDESPLDGWNPFAARDDGPGVGETFGPYRLDAFLGEGAVGRVFRATDTRSGEVVAVKILRRTLADDDVYRRRLEREARVAAEVESKHIVAVVASSVEQGTPYVVVRYVEGETLADRLEREGTLTVVDVVRLVAQVATGLDALHAHGIVHRDVKPSNVLLDESGSAALTDFGLAKGQAYTVLTRTGQAVGTLDYVAPEILSGEEAQPASDIYALGCLTYECATGDAPFASRSMFEVAVAHMEDEPADPSSLRSELPSALGWAILRALAKKPDERPPTAATFANMLKAAAAPR